jgi:phosphoribosylamine--glycine ligase
VKVLVVGAGGREHALAWSIARSPRLAELHAAPGNPGIAALGRCHPVRSDDAEGILALCVTLGVDLVVVGPEAPLVNGVADQLRRGGIAVFGPSAAAARVEGSKTFAKQLMEDAGVPSARSLAVAQLPCVVKADGLAAGKGVYVCRTQEELDLGLRGAAALGGGTLIEEFLEGEEVSLLAITDGSTIVPLAPAQDFKRIRDGDTGPNTGGMGSYSPVPRLGEADVDELVDLVHRPVIEALARDGTPFIGCLYAGLMLTEHGPRVLEFNCRFGDPETQSLLPRLECDLLEVLVAAAAGDLSGVELEVGSQAAVTVVLAGGAYPEHGDTGTPIDGIDAAERCGALVFHAGTALHDGQLVSNGGRVLNVTGVGANLAEARDAAYRAVDCISFPGAQFRSDIAALAHA